MNCRPWLRREACRARGFTLLELLIALAIGSLLLLSLFGVVNSATTAARVARGDGGVHESLRFALARMTTMVGTARGLVLPLTDNPATNWPENLREQTIPASPPVGSSTFASAVLAVLVPAAQDLDLNNIPDADNDGDGRLDEDLASDANRDGKPGLIGIDDDGDGSVDEGGLGSWGDDDEDGAIDEDRHVPAGIDEDGDGSFDEDPISDHDLNLVPGRAGVDDDGDGSIDEGGFFDSWNDDEDGAFDEDWLDVVVYYLNGADLIERLPVPWDASGGGGITGADFVETVLANNVTRFRVERPATTVGQPILIDVVLELRAPASGETVSGHVQVRVGGAL